MAVVEQPQSPNGGDRIQTARSLLCHLSRPAQRAKNHTRTLDERQKQRANGQPWTRNEEERQAGNVLVRRKGKRQSALSTREKLPWWAGSWLAWLM